MMFICSQGEDDYITNIFIKSKSDDPFYKTWKTGNSLDMSWFTNSVIE